MLFSITGRTSFYLDTENFVPETLFPYLNILHIMKKEVSWLIDLDINDQYIAKIAAFCQISDKVPDNKGLLTTDPFIVGRFNFWSTNRCQSNIG